MSSVQRKLEASRKDLLDLGLRNPLISYRARTRSIEVVDEKSLDVHRILVSDGREMSFVPLPKSVVDRVAADANGKAVTSTSARPAEGTAASPLDPDAASGAAAPSDLDLEEIEVDWGEVFAEEEDDGDGPAGRHTDTRLQTRLQDDSLTTRLITIHSTARTCIEEQGVNLLFLAIGFLHWFEAEASSEERRAPLLLIPVELRRGSAQQRFKVAWTGDDVGDNLSLREKLKTEFGIALPAFTPDGDGGVATHFDAVAAALAAQPRWRVTADEISLGFFSFGKFLMYHDLDVAKWPNPDATLTHPVLTALFDNGFRADPSPFSEDAHLDESREADAVHTVVDADSTQTLALLEAASGRTMRIEGPPGTGKSQTITNLIADALGKGRRVLFVSEKMAALEVVKRRLDKLELGDAVLELHSHKANKRTLLEELRRTTDLGRPAARLSDDDLQNLIRVRDRLNDYCRAVNDAFGKSGVSPIAALGRMLELKSEGAGQHRFDWAEMQAWTASDWRERRVLVVELASKLEQMGRPIESLFWGCRIRLLSPVEQDSLRRALEDGAGVADSLVAASTTLATKLGLDAPRSDNDVEGLCRAAARAIEAPHDVGALDLRSGDWQARRDDIRALLEAGGELAAIRAAYEEQLIPEAWDQDLLEVREALLACGGSWWRRLSGRFRRAKSRLRSLTRAELTTDRAQWMAIVDAVMESRRLKADFDRLELLGQGLFRAQWQGLRSDWPVLARLSEWVVALYDEVGDGKLPTGLVDFLSGSPRIAGLQTDLDAADSALEHFARTIGDLRRRLEVSIDGAANAAVRDPLAGPPLADLPARLRDMASRLDELGWLAEFNRLQAALEEAGLPHVAHRAEAWTENAGALIRAFDWTWHEGIFNAAYAERRPLQTFDRIGHEQAIAQFRRLDTDLQQQRRIRLMLRHWEELPHHGADGEVGIVRREMSKKRGWLPIRRLMQDAGRAVQAIKPVFMMSPLSVANFLPPGSVEFDLVVFDEASQVKPVEAIGAVLRGRQTIVVGDTRQLPPTNFFDSIAGPSTEDEDNTTADQESILGLFAAQGAPARMLRWHYRSRHESLIAVSNQEFYDGRLVVFPNAGYETEARGVLFHHLPDTEYGRGSSRSNRGEAKVVAENVMRHARERPYLSLGVAAFSQAQSDAIEMEVELLRRADPSCEEWFQAESAEPFFVKNLENVQGDERDVIFISVGYGKTKDGYLAMNFGPLNRDGGERRLNVLITRARMACEVFSNFTADDLDLARSNARGVAALKTFLAYAKDRLLFTPRSTGREPDSPFEESVIRTLVSAGLEVEPQVGCAGFFIDIGVKDAEAPGRYLLGIECDGAAYHSARSARDRDRLREAVLRGLGWEIHRIWSSDWFRSPDRELKRVLEAVEAARLAHKRREARSASTAAASPSVATPATIVARTSVTRAVAAESTAAGVPYRRSSRSVALRGRQLHELPPHEMAEYIVQIVADEGPVAALEVARRVAEGAGLQRAGSRIQAAVDAGIAFASSRGSVHRRGHFLWPPMLTKPTVRDRSGLEIGSRKLELVCDEEIAAALGEEIEKAFSISQDDAVAAALRRLGFQRVSADMKFRCERVLSAQIREGRVIDDGGRLKVPLG